MRMMIVVGVLASAAAMGCRSDPPAEPTSLEDCLYQVQQCRSQARHARNRYDSQAVGNLAQRSGELAKWARKHPGAVAATQPSLVVGAIETAAAVCEEEERLAGRLNTWNAKAHRAGRKVVLAGVLKTLAFAARQAGKNGLDKLDPSLSQAAQMAGELVYAAGDQTEPAPGDWNAIANELDRMAQSPPAWLGRLLLLGMLVTGKTDQAMQEAQLLDVSPAGGVAPGPVEPLLMGLAWSYADLPKMAAEAVEPLSQSGAIPPGGGREWLCNVHLVLVVLRVRDGDFAAADRELAAAIRVYPQSDVAVFLTGERQAADGQTVAAAQSLERLAERTSHAELARRIASRVKDIRDGKQGTFLSDPLLLSELVCVAMESQGGGAQGKATARMIRLARGLAERASGEAPGP